MKITQKGQVTIPNHIRRILNIMPNNEVEFYEENGRVYLKKVAQSEKKKRFRNFRAIATVKMSTEEIMALTRGEQ